MSRKEVVLAKLSRPRVHDVLPRTRLHGAIGMASRKRVVWLSAQPGAGKTTLVADYLNAAKRPVVSGGCRRRRPGIVRLSPPGVRTVAGTRAADRLPLLTPEYMPDLAGFARRFFRDLYALLGAGGVVVLDNFQERRRLGVPPHRRRRPWADSG